MCQIFLARYTEQYSLVIQLIFQKEVKREITSGDFGRAFI